MDGGARWGDLMLYEKGSCLDSEYGCFFTLRAVVCFVLFGTRGVRDGWHLALVDDSRSETM